MISLFAASEKRDARARLELLFKNGFNQYIAELCVVSKNLYPNTRKKESWFMAGAFLRALQKEEKLDLELLGLKESSLRTTSSGYRKLKSFLESDMKLIGGEHIKKIDNVICITSRWVLLRQVRGYVIQSGFDKSIVDMEELFDLMTNCDVETFTKSLDAVWKASGCEVVKPNVNDELSLIHVLLVKNQMLENECERLRKLLRAQRS